MNLLFFIPNTNRTDQTKSTRLNSANTNRVHHIKGPVFHCATQVYNQSLHPPSTLHFIKYKQTYTLISKRTHLHHLPKPQFILTKPLPASPSKPNTSTNPLQWPLQTSPTPALPSTPSPHPAATATRCACSKPRAEANSTCLRALCRARASFTCRRARSRAAVSFTCLAAR